MSLKIAGRWRSRKKSPQVAAQDPGSGLARVQVRVGGPHPVGRPEGQHGLRVAIGARQVVVMVALDEAEDEVTMALAGDQPVSRVVAASVAAVWAGSVRWSGLHPRLSCRHT